VHGDTSSNASKLLQNVFRAYQINYTILSRESHRYRFTHGASKMGTVGAGTVFAYLYHGIADLTGWFHNSDELCLFIFNLVFQHMPHVTIVT
jgi:hypothetical protein